MPQRLNFRTLDLNLLRVFDEVMAERNLTRAAHKLALTQPAVSNALRRLRVVLNDDLLRRSGAGIEPTPVALSLWPVVREALQQLQAKLAPDHFDPRRATQAFVLAMADATAAELTPGLLQIIEAEAPGIHLRMVPLTTRDPRKLLQQEQADLAVGFFPTVLADLGHSRLSGDLPPFEHTRLYDGEYVCVMRNGHPLAQVDLTLDRFCAARHMLVSFSGRPHGLIDEALATRGRQRQVVLTVNQFFTAGRVVSRSDMLTVLPRHFLGVTGIAHQLSWRPLPFDVPPVHVDMLWHRRRDDGALQWLRRSVLQVAQQAFHQGLGT